MVNKLYEENYDGLLDFVKNLLPEDDNHISLKSMNYKDGWTIGIFYYPKGNMVNQISPLPNSVIESINVKLNGKGTIKNLDFPNISTGGFYSATVISSETKEIIEKIFS
jgi:hypothetical protein